MLVPRLDIPNKAGEKKKIPAGESETSYNILANEKYQEEDMASGRIGGKVWASSPPPQTYLQKKQFKNDLEYYIAWLKGKYPLKVEVLDQVFVVLENAGFLYKSVTKENNHVRGKNVLIAAGVDGAEGLTCLLRD